MASDTIAAAAAAENIKQKIARARAHKEENLNAYQKEAIRILQKTDDTATIPYCGLVAAYRKDLIQPQHPILFAKLAECKTLSGAGTVSTRAVKPGRILPKKPTRARFDQRRLDDEEEEIWVPEGVEWSDPFCDTAIVLNNAQFFDPGASSSDEEEYVRLGEEFESKEFEDVEFLAKPTGPVNKLCAPFRDGNLPDYVNYLFSEYFPDLDRDSHSLVVFGSLPAFVSMFKAAEFGEDVNVKQGYHTREGHKTFHAKHDLYTAKTAVDCVFENVNLGATGEETIRVLPLFRTWRNQDFESGQCPFRQGVPGSEDKMAVDYVKFYKTLMAGPDLPALKGNRFLGHVAASIVLRTPIMAPVDTVGTKKSAMSVLNSRIDAIFGGAVMQSRENINRSVKVEEADLFPAAYLYTLEKELVSQPVCCSPDMFSETPLNLKNAKDKYMKNQFNHRSEQACKINTYRQMCAAMPEVPDDQRQLRCGMLYAPNNVLTVLDSRSVFNTDELETRKDLYRKARVEMEAAEDKLMNFASCLRGNSFATNKNMPYPMHRILARFNGNLFDLKDFVDQCLFVIGDRKPIPPGATHPYFHMTESNEDPRYCEWCRRPFSCPDTGKYCFCAVMVAAAAVLKNETLNPFRINEIWKRAFPTPSVEPIPGAKDIKMESFAINISGRTDDVKNNSGPFGDATLINTCPEDAYGLTSKASYDTKKKLKAEEEGGESSKKPEEDDDIDFDKVKRMRTLLAAVSESVGTFIDREEQGVNPEEEEESDDLLIERALEEYKRTTAGLAEVERGKRGGGAAVWFVAEKAMISAALKDPFSKTNYEIPAFIKGEPKLKVTGTKKTVAAVSLVEEEDFDAESEMLSRLGKRKAGAPEEEEPKKKRKVEDVHEDVRNFARAVYVFCVEAINRPDKLKFFDPAQVTDVYKNSVMGWKSAQLIPYMQQLYSINFGHPDLAARTIDSVLYEAYDTYAKSLISFFSTVFDTVREQCGFESREKAHDRFRNHVKLTKSVIKKDVTVILDPDSTNDIVQKIGDRKTVVALAKYIYDTQSYTKAPFSLNRAHIRSAMQIQGSLAPYSTTVTLPFDLPCISSPGNVVDFNSSDPAEYSLPQSTLPVLTPLHLRVGSIAVAEDRPEIREEKFREQKTATNKRNREVADILAKDTNPCSYKMFPLTAADYIDAGGKTTGGSSRGPLPASVLGALYVNSAPKFWLMGDPDYVRHSDPKHVLNFIKEHKEMGPNNDSHFLSTISRIVVDELDGLNYTNTAAVLNLIKTVGRLKLYVKERTEQPPPPEFKKKLNTGLRKIFAGNVVEPGGDGLDNLRYVMRQNPVLAPVLHLTFTLGQIYGAKVATDQPAYNKQMERDAEAIKCATAGALLLPTCFSGMNKTLQEQTKDVKPMVQLGLATNVTCHVNYYLTENRAGTVATTRDVPYQDQGRTIFGAQFASKTLPAGNAISREIKMRPTVCKDSLLIDLVKFTARETKAGCGLIVKTSATHLNQTKQTFEINPDALLKNSTPAFVFNAINSEKNKKAVCRAVLDYVKGRYFAGALPVKEDTVDLEAIARVLTENHFEGMISRRDQDLVMKIVVHLVSVVEGYREEEEEEYCGDDDDDGMDCFVD